MQSVKNLHKRAVELNSRFNVLFVKYMNEQQDSEDIMKYSQVEKDFTELIHQLAHIINNPVEEDSIYRTYTTGHINLNQMPKQADKHGHIKESKHLEEKRPNEHMTLQAPQPEKEEKQQPLNLTINPPKHEESSRKTTFTAPRTNSSNMIGLAPPPSRGLPLRISRQNTDEGGFTQKQQAFAPKMYRTTTSTDTTESIVKNRFIFDQHSDHMNSSSILDETNDGSIL